MQILPSAEREAGWWARQDSNLQPDRYERPALTIELQAPPQAAAQARRNGADTPYNVASDPAMLRSWAGIVPALIAVSVE